MSRKLFTTRASSIVVGSCGEISGGRYVKVSLLRAIGAVAPCVNLARMDRPKRLFEVP